MEVHIAGSNGIYGRFSFQSFLQAQKKLGIHQIAFHHLPAHIWLDHERCIGLASVMQALQAENVRAVSFHPGSYQYSLFDGPETMRGRYSRRYYQNCIDVAAALACPVLCVRPTGNVLDGERKRDIAMFCTNLDALCRYADDRGITIAVQTVSGAEGALLSTLNELEQVLENVPMAGAVLDTVSVSQAGESIPQWFERVGARIVHVCLQDGRSDGCCIWGEGVYPSRSYSRQIIRSGYHGPISIIGRTDRYQVDPFRADMQNLTRIKSLLSGDGGDAGWD